MKVVVAARLSVTGEGKTGLDTQEQEVIAWAQRNGHEVVGIAADHKTGKSALWDRPKLRPWVTDPERLTEYDALAALKVDRITRADDEGVDAMKAWARNNNKSILITSADVSFPSEGLDGIRWDMYIRMAHQEWLDIKERFGRMQGFKHDANSLIGKPPWGYEIVEIAKGIKALEPTAEGRTWVPRIFGWVAEGEGCRDIAKRLSEAGIKSGAPDGKWHDARIISTVKCQTYSGVRVRKGRSGLQVEPLVSRALQDKAVMTLASRARPGASSPTQPKALLVKLRCGHPDCPGSGEWPMYRINAGKKDTRTGMPGQGWYRCAGKAPDRQGCGAPMISVEVLNALVLSASEYWDSQGYVSQRFVSGNDAGMRLEALRAEMAEAMRVTPAEKIGAVAAEYAAKIAAIEAEGSVLPHWEDVETGMTEGQHLRSLSVDGQREYLGRKDLKAWKIGDRINLTVDGTLVRKFGFTAFEDVESG